jgi:hypothetical protein
MLGSLGLSRSVMRSFSTGDTIRIAIEFESEVEVGRGMAIFHHENDPYWTLVFTGDAEPTAGDGKYRMHLYSTITDNLPAGEYRFRYMQGERYGGQQDGLELAFDRVPGIRVVVTDENSGVAAEPAVAPRVLGWNWE